MSDEFTPPPLFNPPMNRLETTQFPVQVHVGDIGSIDIIVSDRTPLRYIRDRLQEEGCDPSGSILINGNSIPEESEYSTTLGDLSGSTIQYQFPSS